MFTRRLKAGWYAAEVSISGRILAAVCVALVILAGDCLISHRKLARLEREFRNCPFMDMHLGDGVKNSSWGPR